MLILGILLSLPVVQTKIGKYITEQINKDYGTDINVEQVALTVFGGVKLKKVLIKDHHKDTLFYINRLKTNILDFNKLYNGDLLFGDIRMDGLFFHLKQYKNEKETNLDKFVSAFDDGSPSTGKFLMKANAIYLKNSHFTMIDENSEDPKILEFLTIDAQLDGFKIKGTDVSTAITEMSFFDFRGLKVENLKTQFTYTQKNILLQKLKLLTKNSLLNADVALRYKREDFSDFNNKVIFDITVDTASVATNDIRYFYNELGKNNKFNFTASILGTLNDFHTNQLNLVDLNNTKIIGDINFNVKPFPSTSEFIETNPSSFLFNNNPTLKLYKITFPLYVALSILLMSDITKSVCKFPKEEVMKKSDLIDVVVISAFPKIVNCPNFFMELGNDFPKILGNKAAKSS